MCWMYWYALLIDVYYIAIQCNSRHASIVRTCFVLDDCSLCATLSFRQNCSDHSAKALQDSNSTQNQVVRTSKLCAWVSICFRRLFLWLKFERTALLLASQIKGWTESTDVLWYFQIFVFYIGGLKSLMISIVLCDFVMYSWDVRVPGIPKKSSVQLILWRSQQRRRPRQSRTPLQRRSITLQHRRRRKWPTCLGFRAICVVHLVLFPQLLIYLNTFSSRVYT